MKGRAKKKIDKSSLKDQENFVALSLTSHVLVLTKSIRLQPQPYVMTYRCEGSCLRLNGDTIFFTLRMLLFYLFRNSLGRSSTWFRYLCDGEL